MTGLGEEHARDWRHVHALPLAGLVVMVLAGVFAGPYTPSWFDGTGPCTRAGAPCPVDVDPALALRTLSWVVWGGLLLVLTGAGGAAALLARHDGGSSDDDSATTLGARRSVAHAAVAGALTATVVAVGAAASLVATLASSSRLGLAAAIGTWLGLARVLELVHGRLGRARGAATAYLLALAVAALSCLAMVTVLVAREANAWWAGVGVAGLVGALATGVGESVAWDRRPAVRAVGGVAATAAAVTALAGSLSVLGLLRPMGPPVVGVGMNEAQPPQPPQPGPAPWPTGAPTARPATPSPARPDPGVRTGRRCAGADVHLALTGFDAAMGARVATLTATNHSETPCYLDGFATLALDQGGRLLDLRSGTTSTRQPGMEGRATRVGLAPRSAARAALYWRGYGAAADTTTPQTLTVTLHPGAGAGGQRVAVEPWAFDLGDGGELRVGNWVLAG